MKESFINAIVPILTLFLSIGRVFDKKKDEESKKELTNSVLKSLKIYKLEKYRDLVTKFNKLFDTVYNYTGSTRERLGWLGIIITYWVFIILRIGIEIFGIKGIDPPVLLFLTFLISALTILSIAGVFGSRAVRNWLFSKTDNLPEVSDKWLNKNGPFVLPEKSADFINWFGWGSLGAIVFSILSMGLFLSFSNSISLFIILCLLSFPVMVFEFSLFVAQQWDSPQSKPQIAHLIRICVEYFYWLP